MRSTSIPPGHQARGALTIWTALAIAALVCMAAVLVFQVMEYLFYDQPPSVWIGAGPSSAPQAITKPLSESASETNVIPEAVLPGPSTDDTTNAGTEEKPSEPPAASETDAVE